MAEVGLEGLHDSIKHIAFTSEQRNNLGVEAPHLGSSAIDMVNECRVAVMQMPIDKSGIVLGAEGHDWRKKGWDTVNVHPAAMAKFTGDVNHLDEFIGEKRYDYVYAENLPISKEEGSKSTNDVSGFPLDAPNLHPERLLEQVRNTLNPGGKLILQTADAGVADPNEALRSYLTSSEEWAELLRKHGFAPVLEIQNLANFTDPEKREESVRVYWYAQKVG